MAAFISVTVRVKDPEKFKKYITLAPATIALHGGEMVSRGRVAKPLAGAADYHLAAVFRFPSLEAVDKWYDSPEYRKLIPLREESAEMNIIALDEF